MNQFATPGLGSLMAGRILAGLGQLALALLGATLFIIGVLQILKVYYSLADVDAPLQAPHSRYLLPGALFFVASWLWSLLTSISITRNAKIPEPAQPGSVPPRITK